MKETIMDPSNELQTADKLFAVLFFLLFFFVRPPNGLSTFRTYRALQINCSFALVFSSIFDLSIKISLALKPIFTRRVIAVEEFCET